VREQCAGCLLVNANVRLNLLRILLTRGRRLVKVHDSVVIITAVATTVIVVGARGLLVVSLLVVVVAAEYLLVLLAEVGGLLL
jgi:hypothetical protein